jgi:DNA-directed RNA polymerase specialized sigma24 family protein
MKNAEQRSLRDPLEQLAQVARARRKSLLWTHRHRLRHEDLEDCFSQTTFELVRQARAGSTWTSTGHLVNHLDQRFLSRVQDRLRAVKGRSRGQAAMEKALAGGGLGNGRDAAEVCCGVEELVLMRMQLREVPRLARELTADQRLVLVCQVALGMSCAEFCDTYGWSREKYRKVAQRARAKLRRLSEQEGLSLNVTVPPSATTSDKEIEAPPMKIPPPAHRCASRDVANRSQAGPHCDVHPHGGRESGFAVPRLSAARVSRAETQA